MLVILISYRNSYANPVTPKAAENIARHFLNAMSHDARFKNAQLNLVYGHHARDENPESDLLYIFNANETEGFIIIAADDAVTPVLGYSMEGSFDPNDIPINMEKWLEGYKHEIYYAQAQHIKLTEEITTMWQQLQNGSFTSNRSRSVDPLLVTQWNQNPFENLLCPGGSVTGCAATAMAQLMYYWGHPAQGRGKHSYIENDYGTLTANFGSSIYQWGSMALKPTFPDFNIAKLMYDCGVSIEMDYSPAGSGAATSDVPYALKTYFGYDPNTIRYQRRAGISDSNWIAMLKTELDLHRPMQYRGTGNKGAHSFICDGYDANEMFHFNWGWGGASDGYFTVNALNPPALGTGGGAGGFNDGHAVVIGVQPDPNIAPDLLMNQSLYVSPAISTDAYGGSIYVSAAITNAGGQLFVGDVTLAIYNTHDSTLARILTDTIINFFGIGGGGALIGENFLVPELPPGNYYASLVCRNVNTNDWRTIRPTQFTNAASFYAVSPINLSIYEIPLLADDTLYTDEPLDVTVRLQNLSTGAPVFSGSLAINVYDLQGVFQKTIQILSDQTVIFGLPTDIISFHADEIGLPPGTYKLVTLANGGDYWKMVNVPIDYNADTYLVIRKKPIQQDNYEPNDAVENAYVLSTDFDGSDISHIATFTSNNHVAEDEDYYKIEMPSDPDYYYVVSGRMQDAYSSDNGGIYTLDAEWQLNVGSGWSPMYDDVLLIPNGDSIVLEADDFIYLHARPFYAGSSGTYLLDMKVTRYLQTTATHDLLPKGAIVVGPVPAQDVLHISFPQTESTRVRGIILSDVSGKIFLKENFEDNGSDEFSEKINVNHLASGMYLLQLVTTNGIAVEKVMVGK
ncbi:MAG TPA: thiol protease/hemagglutinin PrtT [Saprospiraceae bacterium]|nr:thiol protease/hemagglutinin PrtT [Saprospiraceae bacterium]